MNYSVNKYTLILEYTDSNKEEQIYIGGFKSNSDIIYNEPDRATRGLNGWYIDNSKTSSIEFILKQNSPCIDLLKKLSTGKYLITVKIINGNDSNDVKVKGTTFKLRSYINNTNWIIDRLHEAI